ncbi:MAG TPA: hypothetical protein VK989_11260, partial [Polyangia bacterium]|nr:hypothetical protein [Polyangia bacterium]
ASMSACGTKPPDVTGVTVTVLFPGVVADQLELAVTTPVGAAIAPTRRPAPAAGSLTSPQSVSIFLPDALAGQAVTCTATAVYQGETIGATASAPATLVLHALVPVTLTIPVNRHGDAGADAGADARDANDADASDADASDADASDGAAAKAIGTPCASGGECDSTLCIDGVCCASACDGNCQACNLAGKVGTCTPRPAGATGRLCANQPPSGCGYDGTCDGNGACHRYAAGFACKAASCQAGSYVPASACDGQGACVAASPVDCAPYVCDANGTTPACLTTCQTGGTDCVSPAVCVNGSCGARPKGANGAGCVAAGDCVSNHCADGVCCGAACAGACMSCNQTGMEGVCLPVSAGKTDPHAICKDAGATTCGRNGLCDGAGACALYPATAVCAAGSCKGATLHNARKCDGKGTCLASTDTDCGNYRCDPSTTTCFSSCTLQAQCSAKHACFLQTCQ